MGFYIKIEGADYSGNSTIIPSVFDILSDNSGVPNLIGSVLSISNLGPAGDYNWAASSSFSEVTITMPADSTVAAHAFVIGVDTNGDAMVLTINGGAERGTVRIFSKTGVLGAIPTVYTMAVLPDVSKGNPITFTRISGGIRISYTGYSQDILYSNLPAFARGAIGVFTTGSTANTYTFVV